MFHVPERIAAAASKRINSPEARRLQRRVATASAKNKPAEAEPDQLRRLLRLQAVAGVNAAQARQLLGGEAAANILSGDDLYGAERLIGETVDFLPVSFLTVGQSATAAVARVIQRDGQPVGSGFLISGALFITNNHVIGSREEAEGMLIEFDYETDAHGQPRGTTRFAIDHARFFATSDKDDLDFTVVAVGAREQGTKTLTDFSFCPLSDRGDKHMLGEFVNLVQHPEGDYKQVVLRENKLISRLETVLHYEADTQPGSSGSPVLNDEWEAIALHHWGGPHREQRTGDGQPVASSVNEGIRISAIVKELGRLRSGFTGPRQALLDAALKADGPAPGENRPAPITPVLPVRVPVKPSENLAPSAAVKSGGMRVNPDGTVTLSLEIDVRVVGGRGSSSLAEKIAPDPDYSSRSGYDSAFLPGFPLPVPEVTGRAAGTKARLLHSEPGAEPSELKYEHFSVVMNKSRKFPFVTAANIDGPTSRKVDRKSGRVVASSDGGDESAEAGEIWHVDPRVAATDQTSQPLYDHQQPRVFDRGHQVRREDPVWGDDDSAERANADTFHFTNCCPQEFRFNEQKKFWAGIEDYVLDNARTEQARVSVFTGPVFAATDPAYRGIRVPLQFFKVIARVETGNLKATAFLADQSELLTALPERLSGEERFDNVGRVREYVTTVAEVEEMTGLDFGPLRDHDTHAAEALGTRRPLRAEADLRAALGIGAALRPARDREPAESAPVFSAASLPADVFDWRSALATVLASQLAYADAETVKAKALGEWGLETCQFFDVADTQGFVATTGNVALVAFRGSESVGDWLANLDVLTAVRPYGRIHRGFYYTFMDVRDWLLQTLASLGKSRVVATGHSLGGALATVFAAEAPTSLPIRWVHTYGQPRVGIGSEYADFLTVRYASRFVRFVNENDIVPRVPPLFVHVGRLVHLDAAGHVNAATEALGPAAEPPALTEAEFQWLQAQLRTDRSLAVPGAEGILPSVSDHAIAKYVAKVAAQVP